ncbi:hypothetical protein GGX14DRAFT_594284 [Mycena pura]|uniref:BTB domain-containing protein n=1 Tax=Mycena pura TaxID=153505 RepID=A0AAD6USJ1_9AGAR|nr:hypothetical protein GGX14DRAFT_594284 [Mycena pura]
MAAPQDKCDLKPNAPEESLGASLPAYHADFASVDSDIVLASSGTLYRVHSYTLRTTSGLFRTILSLPPPGHSPSPIEIHEPDAVVEPLLRPMCGFATPPWPSLDALSAVLSLAEKWSAPGPVAFLHTALSADTFLSADPLRIYALATHFGWRATAQRAAAATLTLDLSAPAHAPRLSQLAAPALLALLRLHRTRRDALRALLDSPERFLAGNGAPFHCAACESRPSTTPPGARSSTASSARPTRGPARTRSACVAGDARVLGGAMHEAGVRVGELRPPRNGQTASRVCGVLAFGGRSGLDGPDHKHRLAVPPTLVLELISLDCLVVIW